MNENTTSIIQGILNVCTDGWQRKQKSRFVGWGYLDVTMLETDV